MQSKTLFATCLLLAATNGVLLSRSEGGAEVPMVIKETTVQNLSDGKNPVKTEVVEVRTSAKLEAPRRPFALMKPNEFTRIPTLDSLFSDLNLVADKDVPQLREEDVNDKIDSALESVDFDQKVDGVIEDIDFGFEDVKEVNANLERDLVKGEQKLQNMEIDSILE